MAELLELEEFGRSRLGAWIEILMLIISVMELLSLPLGGVD